ncbi:DUF721 domain-containing protein [Pseudomethylobacillus aquaticus]|uniref:DUF721 domain-containing protein n=1 Tax=Pseudomethylobacillus aquaticus TaxID=2676064 RepID=A0A3N0V1J5_9PROT|nr:DciA family protein [Pseudomethylobacillus aquaticus]ROH86358.1 DUF721 domain-containing protein [Pseudomethylobacillus aquaticus]
MQRIGQFLQAQHVPSTWSDLLRDSGVMQAVWKTTVPEALQPYLHVGRLQDHELVVFATNGSVAAKLRLLTPTMLNKLQKQGLEVTSIRVRVQVLSASQPSIKPKRTVSTAASRQLQQLAESLGESPLSEVIKRLASHR